MSIHILDASAIVAYENAETGGTVVRALLANPTAACFAHTINLCEVYYHLIRKTDVPRARQGILQLFADGVIERNDMDRHFWQRVGEHKARGKISLPDCFCISLAQELGGEVVTADHHEFDPIVPLGIVPITFIR
ncbi:MAG: PIN domain-containing protein [Capsulimonadaceae bacterium]